MNYLKILSIPTIALSLASAVLADEPLKPETLPAGENMYVIEREIPGLGKMTPEELKAVSQKSCAVLKGLGPKIQWLHSYVTGDKMYCIYLAPDAALVREHAKQGGFPANAVNQVTTIVSPKTAQ